jgi:hypothetical protein
MTRWWHLAQTRTGSYAEELDMTAAETEVQRRCTQDPQLDADLTLADVITEVVAGIRDRLGFPPDWLSQPGWGSRLAPGEPHPGFLATATVTRIP